MKRYVWVGVVVGSALALACESSKQVGSACKGGVCPEATAAVQGASCAVSDTSFAVAFLRGDGGVLHDQGICLPGELPIEDGGVVDCAMYVTNGGDASADAGPLRCDEARYLEAAPGQPEGVCRIHQLTTQERAAGKDGWYYDAGQNKICPHGGKRIVITDPALPLDGQILNGTCLTARVATDDAGVAAPIAACGPLPARAVRRVGDACPPPLAPQGGFDDRTATLQTASDACSGGACVVYHLRGDPSPDCKGDTCAASEETSQRVFCTCRCDAPKGQADLCECPQGFLCQPLLENGPDTLRGGYCVRDGI